MNRDSESVGGDSRTLHRALDVLEFLAGAGRPVALGEIAVAVPSPKATLHRVLTTLHTRGYVAQEPASGRYSMGVRCFELGSLWAQNLDLRAVAAPHLRWLNEEVGETIHLALYEHGDVIYVDKLDSPRPIIPQSHVGRRCPATSVSTGRALLAFQPLAEIERVLDGPQPAYTPHTVTDRDELLAMLDEVRRQGYAINVSSFREGVCGLAAPIRDHTGAVVASVGCCLPESRFGDDRIPDLREATAQAAAAISRELGWMQAVDALSGDGRRGEAGAMGSAAR
jgi:DNA-binding IclR family transcriptional regulator